MFKLGTGKSCIVTKFLFTTNTSFTFDYSRLVPRSGVYIIRFTLFIQHLELEIAFSGKKGPHFLYRSHNTTNWIVTWQIAIVENKDTEISQIIKV